MKTTVLLVEDDDALRELLGFHLGQAGFAVVEVATAKEAWEHSESASLIVLDWMLPDETGVDWLKRFRLSSQQDKPVLMLTAKASEVNKVTGLNAGADDYLTKPFSSAELTARIKALLRRTKTAVRYEIADLLVDEEQGRAYYRDEQLQLTRREFDLLSFFSANPNRIFSRMDLLDRVWGEDFLGTDRTVDQHVAQLRALIGADYIETVRGRGYRLVDPKQDS